MKKSLLLYCLVAACCSICAVPLKAQVIVTLQQPPAFEFKIEHMWRLTLNNTSRLNLNVYMIGRATEKNSGNSVRAITGEFALPPGLKVLRPREIRIIDVQESNSRYTDVVKNIGGVPSGDYTICVTVYDAATHAVLGEMCVESAVLNLTHIELLQPPDDARFTLDVGRHSRRFPGVAALLAEIPEGYDARVALWALLRVVALEIRQIHETPYAVSTAAESQWLPALPLPDGCPPDCSFDDWQATIRHSGQAGQLIEGTDPAQADHLLSSLWQAVHRLQDPSGFLTALQAAAAPSLLLNTLLYWLPAEQLPPPEFWDLYEYVENEVENVIPLPGALLTLSWLPPAPLPHGARVSYTLKMTEIVGRQSAYDAVHSNPAVILIENMALNMVQLPVAARRLQPGRSYAWQVSVYLNGTLLQLSEVRYFTICEDRRSSGIAGKLPPGSQDYQRRAMYGNTVYPGDAAGRAAQSWNAHAQPGRSSVATDMGGTSIMYRQSGTDGSQRARWRTELEERPLLFASLASNAEYLNSPDMMSGMQVNTEARPFALTGSARIDAQHASRVASYSEMPRNHLTADFRPGFMLYGLPFIGNLQHSTLQDPLRQSMNAFSLNFDFAHMRSILQSRLQSSLASADDFPSLGADALTDLADPSLLSQHLDSYSSISPAERLFMSIKSLGIGTNYPSYSEHVLEGVPVTGVNIEVNPGIFHTAFTASRNQRPIENIAYRRDLYAGRLGIGERSGDHLHFVGLFASDDPASLRPEQSNPMLTPRGNYVFAAQGKVDIFAKKLFLEGEGAMSLFTRDTRDPEFASSSVPQLVKDITNPRLSSSVDYMYTGRLLYANLASATELSAGIKMIGPGYSSLGAPNLRTDQFGYEAKFDQQLFGRRVSIGSFFRTFSDNLIDWKSATTTMTAYGLNVGANFPRLPYLRVSYSPVIQKSDATDPAMAFETSMSMLNVMTGYSYFVGGFMASTSLSYMGQETETGNDESYYESNSLMLSNMLSFNTPLTVGVTLGLIESRAMQGYGMIRTADLNGSAPLGEIFSVGAGISIAFERDRNERFGFHANTTVALTTWLDFDLRLERTSYNEFLFHDGSYREVLASASIMSRW
jgi:hypothetical protein